MTRIQLACDFIDSVAAAELAVRMGGLADWIEAGTPMLVREGLQAVRVLRAALPTAPIVADLKIVDAGRALTIMAIDAGATVITVLGCAEDVVIEEVAAACHARGALVCADLIGMDDKLARAHELAARGVDYVTVHASAANAAGAPRVLPLGLMRAVQAAGIPYVVAGGVNAGNAKAAGALGPAVIVAGSAVMNAPDPVAALRALRAALA